MVEFVEDLGTRLPKPTSKQKRRFCKARCLYCEAVFECRFDDFKVGKVKSCGCMKGLKEGSYTHNLHKHKLYAVHAMIKQRCTNRNHPQFKDWGGRGITYCTEWEDFLVFYKWATQNGYAEGLQIDREDNDGNYEPSNCRFVTPKVNMSNRRCSIK